MDNLVVGIIVLAAIAYIAYKLYQSFSGKGGCGCGCGGNDKSNNKGCKGC